MSNQNPGKHAQTPAPLRSAFAHSGAAVEFRARAAKNADALDRLVQSETNPARKILFKDATIITGTADHQVLRGNVLVVGTRIAEVGPNAGAGVDDTNGVVIDASDHILMPGFVDSHLHAWEGQLRGMSPDADFDQYLEVAHKSLGTLYRPHDTYIGNLVTSLVSLYAGVTTIVDNSHNSRSRDHSSAAVEALFDSGIRAVHAAAAPRFGEWEQQWPTDLDRLQEEYFTSADQLVTLRMMDTTADAEAWRFAHERGLWVSSEIGSDWVDNLLELHRQGLVTDTHTFNHCLGLSHEEWQIIADTGVKVNICPRSDTLFGLGPSFPAIDEALSVGVRPGLSMDNELSYGVDMFSEMSVLTHLQRGRVHQRRNAAEENVPEPISAHDAIEFATLRGAENAGLIDRVGSIEVGKEADIILIDTTVPNTLPATDPVATVVAYAHPGNVSDVFVGGDVRKWDGHLVGVDMHAVRAVAEQSRDWLVARQQERSAA
ncbi:amidohydrolase family protein [Streptomyces sp. enrichment culture]|uniref:amidohydrolase family protein n=1 Tax=Streptomyces sp. enrichment culture TaxID=1795815 RepID=UPI003F54DF98